MRIPEDELMKKINGAARNPKDPLLKTAPERVRHLILAFSDISDGFSAEDVVKASASMMITVLRQAHPSWRVAEPRINELFGQAKQLLKNHYDGADNRKVGIFPYDQSINMPLLDTRKKPPEN